MSPEVVGAMTRYDWPGNIRELANVIAQVTAICDGPIVLMEHLPSKIKEQDTYESAPRYKITSTVDTGTKVDRCSFSQPG